ncbi:protein DDC8 homolog [Myotis daubentonii]|uniref:protein DDC8 homolog n=1 Tax=Myotis daubentonii TaxID=98922 RepID=UPI002872DDCD|nr:protein DDC8 homolog [Myotis daubentonii]XP_059527392.1 protein DDC8 homolog [Myotis daubentonii]XP_059527393.1 protein DDC8 homolog [Myotis daubentonii]
MASKISHAKQGAERAAYQSPHPGDQALLPKQKHTLPQVPEKGRLAVQRRPDPGPWRSPQPQRRAEELRSGWPEAPHPRARDLDRLHIAHLLGAGGGWSVEPRPDLQGPARRGATGRLRARGKQRAAARGEKRRQEDLVRLRPYPLKSRRTAVGAEKKGAGKAGGLPHPAPGPPEKSKGKRRSSRKTGGGHRPDPRVRGDLDMGTLWASAGGVVLLGDRERDGAPGRRRSPARTARLAPGPKNDGPGQEDNPEPPWPVDVTCGRGPSPPVSPPQRREGSKWKRELESVFRELFSTNRKLKTYLEARPGADTCPSEELGFPEPCGCQGEPCWERRAGDLLMELAPGPAQADARPAVPSTNLKELLCQLKDRQYRRLVEPLLSDEGYLASHPEEESPLWCGLRPRQEPPRPDMLLSQLRPPAQVGRARSEPAWPKQSREQRWRPQLVEVLELPQLSWEALGRPPMEPGEEMTETETEAETGPQMSAHVPAHVPAPVPGPPSPDLEEAGGCERSTAAPPATSPLAASSEEEDDNDTTHSQMIRDLEEQILEQSKSHKQFLEQARRRLQEFQC